MEIFLCLFSNCILYEGNCLKVKAFVQKLSGHIIVSFECKESTSLIIVMFVLLRYLSLILWTMTFNYTFI